MPRTRTPSERKWLINERAVLAGELAALEAEEARLATRKAHLLRMMAALDTAHAHLAPEAPTMPELLVHAHTRYGDRGQCIQWVREMLQACYPEPVATSALTLAAVQRFGIDLSDPLERSRFRRNSLRAALRKLEALGQAERVHAPSSKGVADVAGRWRWVPSTRSFAELVAQVQEVEAMPWP